MSEIVSNTDQRHPVWVPRSDEYCRRELFGDILRRTRTSDAAEENRTTVTINTAQEDRHGTIIEPSGAQLADYKRNPVVLINHDYSLLAGVSTVSKRDGKVEANMRDEDWDLDDERIAPWQRKVRKGLMKGASIGFRALEVVKELIDEDGDPWAWDNLRYIIRKWTLLEWSYVSVPSNPGAVVTARQLHTPTTTIDLHGLDLRLAAIETKLGDRTDERSVSDAAAPAPAAAAETPAADSDQVELSPTSEPSAEDDAAAARGEETSGAIHEESVAAAPEQTIIPPPDVARIASEVAATLKTEMTGIIREQVARQLGRA